MNDASPVLLHSVVDKDGDQYATATLTPTDDTREKIVLSKPYIIPVLFLPGIMGTNLRKKNGKQAVWQPPNADLRGAADMIAQLFSYAFKNTQERAGDLVTSEAEVDPGGPIDAGESGLPKNVLVARGWGALMRSSYHPFMAQLQHQLNALAQFDFRRCEADLKGWAEKHGHEAPTEWGAADGEPLTREEILHAANYQFDVWAGGYNWLQSNRDSGAAIRDLIENTILPYYNEGREVIVDAPNGEGGARCTIRRRKPNRPLAEKVIVVTHSMGGLVSRALTEIHQCDSVMGVSHGVQPATGAPATYKRMRAGFEGAAKLILGRHAADVVAILSQAPGGLELLPTADYNDGQPWLKVREKARGTSKEGAEILALPMGGDPYNEIYLSPAWYGLVPDGNLNLVNPASQIDSRAYLPDSGDARDKLELVIQSVRTFHESIEMKYKSPTYAHYGAQGKRTQSAKEHDGLYGTSLMEASDLFTWGEIAWEGTGNGSLDPSRIELSQDDGKGTLTTTSGVNLTLSAPDCPGDGTVPCYSGAAPGKAGVTGCFAHGQGNPGECNEHFGYDHQGSYGDKYQRSLYATMYAIVKIAQQAQWHKKESK
ncbi:esterase/lipase family protein [Paraburkholderia sacchari]|uniref:esterase/lipase family protein n=1 Tax=Paraburkholderia sacchari TaxID=159450 RepID=UPI003D97C4B8